MKSVVAKPSSADCELNDIQSIIHFRLVSPHHFRFANRLALIYLVNLYTQIFFVPLEIWFLHSNHFALIIVICSSYAGCSYRVRTMSFCFTLE